VFSPGFGEPIELVGHDIGLMVSYAYAAQFPGRSAEARVDGWFLPGIGNWKDVWLARELWHFHGDPGARRVPRLKHKNPQAEDSP
jgi:hypothetical protein